jgi:hypothetical protein
MISRFAALAAIVCVLLAGVRLDAAPVAADGAPAVGAGHGHGQAALLPSNGGSRRPVSAPIRMAIAAAWISTGPTARPLTIHRIPVRSPERIRSSPHSPRSPPHS